MKKISVLILAISLIINGLYAQVVPISTARTYAQGQSVSIRGIVLNGATLGPIRYIQDATGGLPVYFPSVTNNWNVGDSVTVSGSMGIFMGLIQIVNVTSNTVHTTGNPLPNPLVVTPNGMNINNEAQLLKINNATFANAGGTFTDGTHNFTSGGQSAVIYLRSGHPLIGTTIPLAAVNITGIASQFNGTPQLLPRYAADLEAATTFYITSPPQQTNLSQTGFTLSWQTNIAGSTKLLYGTDPNNLNSVLDLGGANTTHTANLTGLTAGTIYYAKVASEFQGAAVSAQTRAYATVSTSSGQMELVFNQVVDNSISTGTNAVYLSPAAVEAKIIGAIDQAQQTVDVSIYNINRDPIVTALNNAVNRGVVVRLVTNIGSANTALQNVTPLFAYLAGNGSDLMHNKFVVVDADNASNALVITGSMNFTQQNILDDYNNVVFIKDQSLARAYTVEFEEMWGSTGATPGIFVAKFGSDKTDNTPHRFLIGGTPIELYFSPSDGTTAAISAALQSADTDLEFAVLTFTRNDLGDDIINAHNNGVQVRGIIENINDTGSEFPELTNAGVSVIDHPQSGQLHHKYAIVDEGNANSDPLVVTGSHNWSSAAESSNDENTIVIHNASIANQFAQEFNARWLGWVTNTPHAEALRGFEVATFPTPAKDFLTIEMKSEDFDSVEISVVDMTGKILHTRKFNQIRGSSQHTLDVSDLPNGNYLLSFRLKKNVATFKRFQVVR